MFVGNVKKKFRQIKITAHILNVFEMICDQCNASLLNKIIKDLNSSVSYSMFMLNMRLFGLLTCKLVFFVTMQPCKK